MNSKEKGDSVVAEAIAYYTRNSQQVLIPLGDKQKYDLVVDDGKQLLKIQCKYTSFKKPSGAYQASLCVKGGNRSCNTSTPYKEGDFDVLFVMTADRHFFVIPADETNKLTVSITLGDKYDKYKLTGCVPDAKL